ncbi:MAG: hypothetical protein K2N43_01010, partial [Lachnospiraceae bacterium]|nr:hypothetical protein [Lachnospiraceae bacterium]
MGTTDRADDVKNQEKDTVKKKKKRTVDKAKVAENKKKAKAKKARQKAQQTQAKKEQRVQEKKAGKKTGFKKRWIIAGVVMVLLALAGGIFGYTVQQHLDLTAAESAAVEAMVHMEAVGLAEYSKTQHRKE